MKLGLFNFVEPLEFISALFQFNPLLKYFFTSGQVNVFWLFMLFSLFFSNSRYNHILFLFQQDVYTAGSCQYQ